jgi:hypothetical protein
MVNALGSLDVDIILDEGPDTVNMMADTYETMIALAQQGATVPPQVIIELSPLPASTKKKLIDMMAKAQQPDPAAEQAKQIALAGEQAKVEETQSKTVLNMARAQAENMPQQQRPQAPPKQELPIELQAMKAMAEIDAAEAGAEQKRAQAAKVRQEASMAPMQFAQDIYDRDADRALAGASQQEP